MDCFENGRTVRLCSHYGKYLVAMEDKVSVTQDRNESDNCAIWTIELNTRNNNIRLKSCYDMYLTASTESSNLDLIGRKVIQSLQPSSDSSVEWTPIRDGDKMKFQTESGSCLRADGGVPPLRNMVTHKVPSRSPIHQHYLWHVDSLGTQVHKPTSKPGPGKTPAAPKINPRDIKDAAITAGALVGEGGAISGMFTAIQLEIGEKKAHEEEDAANNKAAGVMDDEGDQAAGIAAHKPTSKLGPGKTPAARKLNPHNIKDAAITAGAMAGEGGAISGMFTAIQSETSENQAHEEEDAANNKAAGVAVHKPTSKPVPARTSAAPKMNPRNIKDATITAGAMVGKGGAISGMFTAVQSKTGEKKAHEEEDAANNKAAGVADDEGDQAAVVVDDVGDQAAEEADDYVY